MDSWPIVKVLRNPFRILRAERFFFSAGFLLLLFTLDAVNNLIRFFFAPHVNPEAVFLADGLFNCLSSLEFNISPNSFPFLHQCNGVIGDCPDEQILQSGDCPVDNRFLLGFRRRMILYSSLGLYNMVLQSQHFTVIRLAAGLENDPAHWNLKCQIGIASSPSNGYGGRRTMPFAYTEQGISMLASVLHSEVAVQMSISIMRTFVELRRFYANNAALFDRISSVELRQLEYQRQTNEKFNQVFAYIGSL